VAGKAAKRKQQARAEVSEYTEFIKNLFTEAPEQEFEL
jgi:hypothetical protein